MLTANLPRVPKSEFSLVKVSLLNLDIFLKKQIDLTFDTGCQCLIPNRPNSGLKSFFVIDLVGL